MSGVRYGSVALTILRTPVGNFPVPADAEIMLERATQSGERFSFRVDQGGRTATYLTGRVHRNADSASDFRLDTGHDN